MSFDASMMAAAFCLLQASCYTHTHDDEAKRKGAGASPAVYGAGLGLLRFERGLRSDDPCHAWHTDTRSRVRGVLA